MSEIVDTPEQAAGLVPAPLLVRRPLEAFLDAHGLGRGPVAARRIGEGHSNVTYLVEREGARLVLRRPPRPPLPPSAHDVLREARLLSALEATAVRAPKVLAVCADDSILGVPFYCMPLLEGDVVTDALPRELDVTAERRRLGEELVDALVELHAVDPVAAGLEGFGRADGYLERQLRRFGGLWEVNRQRDIPLVERVGAALAASMPPSGPPAIVHGDYRLGNVLVGRSAPARLVAILDWELATLGDPLADLGYLVATWSDATALGTVLELSPVTSGEGFPTRRELVERYAERSGVAVGDLSWYGALALWKGAVFCEAIYGRHLRGHMPDPWAASLAEGVPGLVEAARRLLEGPA